MTPDLITEIEWLIATDPFLEFAYAGLMTDDERAAFLERLMACVEGSGDAG